MYVNTHEYTRVHSHVRLQVSHTHSACPDLRIARMEHVQTRTECLDQQKMEGILQSLKNEKHRYAFAYWSAHRSYGKIAARKFSTKIHIRVD